MRFDLRMGWQVGGYVLADKKEGEPRSNERGSDCVSSVDPVEYPYSRSCAVPLTKTYSM